jgi:hypothetical protein
MGRRGDVRAFVALAAGAWLAGSARAAAQGPAKDPPKLGPVTRDAPWSVATERGRGFAKAGDCKAAVDAFDEAARHVVDPTVLRDRGLCHQALGNTFPAVDDFRRYLYERPDAADAPDIRARLAKLKGEKASAPGAEDENPFHEEKRISDANAPDAEASTTGSVSLDAIKAREARETDAERSALRFGKGFLLGLYVDVRRWGAIGYGWGQAVGATARWSVSSSSTLLLEAGYANINGENGAPPMDGATIFLGYEARFALDMYATHSLFAGLGFGYEHLNQAAGGLTFATMLPRARAGYRFVVGPSLGLEIGLDGGPAFQLVANPPAGASNEVATTWFLGLKTGIVVGF